VGGQEARSFGLSVIALMVLPGVVGAQFGDNAPKAPKELRASKGQVVLLHLHGKGEQLYVCQAAGDGASAPKWKFNAPKADLFGESGERVGRHFGGPTWEAQDGSKVVGKVMASAPSPDTNNIPWLLLTMVSRSEKGIFSRVDSIQRLDTKGGTAPTTTCTLNEEKGVDYEAEYYFYGQPMTGALNNAQ